MAESGEYSPRTYGRRFGSWNEAVEAAGVRANESIWKLSEEELISELQRRADELGRQPISTDVVEHGKHALATYQRRFGRGLRQSRQRSAQKSNYSDQRYSILTDTGQCRYRGEQ